MAVFYVVESEGVAKDLMWSGGTTNVLYHNIEGPAEIPAPIYYDEAQTAPVANGNYGVSATPDLTDTFSVTVSDGQVVSFISGSGSGTGSGSDSGSGSGIVSVFLPSCRNISETAQANPQAIVDAVKSELIKLRNNPMALGSITNRIVYLILNGQSAPRNFNTRFVKPVDTVRNIVSVALKGSVSGNQPYALYSYETFNGNPFLGTLYYMESVTGIGIGTKVFTNIESSIPAADGNYTSTFNGDITVLSGIVTEFTPPEALPPK